MKRWEMVQGSMREEPTRKLHQWYERACKAGIELPERAALATADGDGRPSVRFVLMRGYDDAGLLFFSNYHSRKALDLQANPRAALAIHWLPLGLQLRVEGQVQVAPAELSDRYFDSRPAGNRAAAIESPQSREVADYDDLLRRVEDRLAAGESALSRPEDWGGYRLAPDLYEFWVQQEHRLHEREQWQKRDGVWVRSLLAP